MLFACLAADHSGPRVGRFAPGQLGGGVDCGLGGDFPDVNPCSLAVELMTCPLNALRTVEALIRVEAGERAFSSWSVTPERKWADR